MSASFSTSFSSLLSLRSWSTGLQPLDPLSGITWLNLVLWAALSHLRSLVQRNASCSRLAINPFSTTAKAFAAKAISIFEFCESYNLLKVTNLLKKKQHSILTFILSPLPLQLFVLLPDPSFCLNIFFTVWQAEPSQRHTPQRSSVAVESIS